MRLASIIQSESTQDSVVLTTEPPMTHDVFKRLTAIIAGRFAKGPKFDNGRLVFPMETIGTLANGPMRSMFNQALVKAFTEDEQEKNNAERDRLHVLNGLSDSLGLPLE